ERLAELASDTQELVTMLVADADGDRHRHDAPQQRCPERIDELLVVADEQNEAIAAPRPDALQVMQDPQRALVQLGKGNAARIVLALQISDAARGIAVALDELRESRSLVSQRRSSLMCRGYFVRKLICASSSSGMSGTC